MPYHLANILYSKTNKYKIGDLGETRIAHRLINDEIKDEESRYIAPELLKEHEDTILPDLTKADIYSFGVIIWELMTGNLYLLKKTNSF